MLFYYVIVLNKKAEIAKKLNHWGTSKTPFFFIIDFECKQPILFKLDEAPEYIFYNIGQQKKLPISDYSPSNSEANFSLIEKATFSKAFNKVQQEIYLGNSYLTNLSFPHKQSSNIDLKGLFQSANAPYKLLIEDQCLVFSPEPFIKIHDHQIMSFPMKGTIDARIPDAANLLMENKKEQAEHATIVDLIRNDLSIVAKNVRVESFRYLEYIGSAKGGLLQTSSKIVGDLVQNYEQNIGSILMKLLPAGSISGAPKQKTVQIIEQAEERPRNYYTGVFGYFDGRELQSSVMIRCIQKHEGSFYYHSGGGITSQSNLADEYQELAQKIYVPIYRDNQISKGESTTCSISPTTV